MLKKKEKKIAPAAALLVISMSTNEMVSKFAREAINSLFYAIRNISQLLKTVIGKPGKTVFEKGCEDELDDSEKKSLNTNKCIKKVEMMSDGLDYLFGNDTSVEKKLEAVEVEYCFCNDKDLCNSNSHVRPTTMMAVLIGMINMFGAV